MKQITNNMHVHKSIIVIGEYTVIVIVSRSYNRLLLLLIMIFNWYLPRSI